MPTSINIGICRPLLSLLLCTCIFSSVFLAHAATSPHGLLPTSLFFHVFLPHFFLGGAIVPYYPPPPPATLPLAALPFRSVVWHFYCLAVSYPSCACFLLETAPERLLYHDSKCGPYPLLALCIHFLHTVHTFILLVHGRNINLSSCIFSKWCMHMSFFPCKLPPYFGKYLTVLFLAINNFAK